MKISSNINIFLLESNAVRIFDKLTIDEHWRRLRINNANQLFCIRIICICVLKEEIE
jgi:hypothetical protein